MNSIYHYTDYRHYLGDYYKEQKERNPYFSYQVMANSAGFKSKTYIYKIINGQKNLARVSILNVAKALKLKRAETAYFEALVNFSDARSVRDKEYYFRVLQELGHSDPARPVLKSQVEYFSHWYYVVIRELITIRDIKDDFRRLARLVDPPITPEQAQQAVKVLLELGLVQKLKSGRYIQTNQNITTDADTTPFAVKLFQKESLKLASSSIERHNKKFRDISTLTMGISEDGFEQIRDEIAAFRRRIVEIVKKDNPADRVYQFNFQLFPTSRIQSKSKDK